jgi:GT2 family glycosyltransferase
MKRLVSVIIPNYNGRELLPDCLNSLNKQTFKEFEVILVDNNSTDDSLEFIKTNFKDIKIIQLKKNFGFAKAINTGVKASSSKYVIFLNNDTKADSNYIKNLVQAAIDNPEVISINPKILNFYSQDQIDGKGIMINEVGQARSVGFGEKDLDQYEKEHYIFGATGGASLFKREDFIKVGLFDEDYFMYSEEVDFAFRAQFLGYKSIYTPNAIVFHKHKATSQKFPQYIEYWQFKNMYQTIIKDFPTTILFRNFRFFKIVLVFLNTIFYQLKKGFFWPPITVSIWLLFNLPNLLIKRRNIQSKKIVTDEYIESLLSKKEITFWGLRK